MIMTKHIRFLEAVSFLFPDAKLTGPASSRDVRITDDGSGPSIAYWNIPAPIPTEQEIVDALAAKDAKDAVEDARIVSVQSDGIFIDIMQRMSKANASEISTWIDNNVANLASARTVLKAIVLALVILNKRTK